MTVEDNKEQFLTQISFQSKVLNSGLLGFIFVIFAFSLEFDYGGSKIAYLFLEVFRIMQEPFYEYDKSWTTTYAGD